MGDAAATAVGSLLGRRHCTYDYFDNGSPALRFTLECPFLITIWEMQLPQHAVHHPGERWRPLAPGLIRCKAAAHAALPPTNPSLEAQVLRVAGTGVPQGYTRWEHATQAIHATTLR